MKVIALGLVLAAMPAYSQLISFGVKGGVPLTDAFTHPNGEGLTAMSAYNRPYLIGPTAEVHLPFHLSFEVDALYRRNGFEYTFLQSFYSPIPPTFITFVDYFSRASINDWQVPLLAKYELKGALARPFLDGGVVYRHVSGSVSQGLTPDHSSGAGVAVGAGLSLKLGFVKLSPEIRYTYWPAPPYSNSTEIFSSMKNQADLLLGFTF
jgi:hypothetical protein